MFTLEDVLREHHDDMVKTVWALAKMRQCMRLDGDIELTLAVTTAFNQLAHIVRFIDTNIPGMREQTLAIRTDL
jgi:hypothetical protein